MSRRQLSKLCIQAEKQLAQLGQKREHSNQNVQLNRQQQQTLSQMIFTYRGAKEGKNVLLWQNSASMAQALVPMHQKLAQKETFLLQEHLRIDRLWRKQLARQQGLKWFDTQLHLQDKARAGRSEQVLADDLAGIYYRNKS